MVTCWSRGQVFVTWSSDRYVFKFLSHDHVVTLLHVSHVFEFDGNNLMGKY